MFLNGEGCAFIFWITGSLHSCLCLKVHEDALQGISESSKWLCPTTASQGAPIAKLNRDTKNITKALKMPLFENILY